jgi:hypothetical protein
MDTNSIPAPYAFFKKLADADDNLRKKSDAMDATLTDEQRMSMYSRQQAMTIAIDLWDSMSKGIGSYDELVNTYRRFYSIMESNAAADDLYTGSPNPDAYKKVLEMLNEIGIDFKKRTNK